MRTILNGVLTALAMAVAIQACSVTKDSEETFESPLNTSFDDGLVATDAIGRTLPTYSEAGDVKPGSYVGLFYWLWHSKLRNN